ncbi:DNA ligase [Acinetobacter phage ZZ1]|uniref:DNA ligase n=1 Tax=Acinetobacter phage ZZ1 TaxID=1049283 RepID=I3WW44_9CAUD|nr:DNA ligase [Acinetobacter phage ZZ1]AFL47714.1 DNA ligase [Acinetobacter phage ZZ1]
MILDILNEIAATDSTNQKQEIIKEYAKNDIFKRVFRMAYHPRLQYGIKKIPFYDVQGSDTERSLDDVLNILEQVIATRQVTGNAAIAMLADCLSSLPEADAIVVERVIARDLDIGAGATIANKVWKGLIPKQPQMLASSMSAKALAEIKYPAYAQLKADGARCFAEIRGDNLEDVKLFSRAGNEYLGLDILKSDLISMTRAFREVHGPCMVDGELVYFASKDTGNQAVGIEWMMDNEEVTGTAQVVSDKESKAVVALRSESNGIANKSLKGTISKQEAASMSFQVWDLVPLKVIYDGEKSLEYSVRFQQLTELAHKSRRVILIESTIVNNVDEAREIYKSYVEQGLEGIILKNTFGLWENKRSKNQVKFKEEITIDLRIVGVVEYSKDPSKVGAVLLLSDDNLIRVKCGSGFTDTNAIKVKGEWIDIPFDELDELNRTKLMVMSEELIGTIAEIKCNGWITAEGRKDHVSLFLPIILKLRRDKTDTNTLVDVFPDAMNVIGE